VLSSLAHDLRLSFEHVEVESEGGEVEVRCLLDSLQVDGVVTRSGLEPDGLSAAQKAEVVATARSRVLETDRHPTATFRATATPDDDGYALRGELELHGVARKLGFEVERDGPVLRGRVQITPSEFGIAPYRAMLGALRLQDRVIVEIEQPFAD
jgi:hypothetical protein